MFPRWSPDGGKIVFARGVNTDFSVTQGVRSGKPPDFRPARIAGILLTSLVAGWAIYCRHASRQLKYRSLRFSDPEVVRTGTRDSRFPKLVGGWKFIYFLRTRQNPAVLRVRIGDRKVEEVPDLKGLATTGYWGTFLALTLDDSPLLLRNLGTQDVYALDWSAP
jgi:hypothetical protein